MSQGIINLFEKHKFVRRCIVLWAMTIITYGTVQMYGLLTEVNTQANVLHTTTVGILSLVLGFYIKLRREEKHLKEQSLKEIQGEFDDP